MNANVTATIAEQKQDGAAQAAAGSSFYAGMRILPADQREAMYEIYSFCRKIDDVADGGDPRPQRVAALEQWRTDIEALYQGTPPAHLRRLAVSVARFGLRKGDFLDLIDGMEMDALADIRAPDYATLDRYCDRVASAVGRLSVRIFGMSEVEGIDLAHHLGRALQLTNILRDLDEDAGIGRLYLPREALQQAGIAGNDPDAVLAHPNLATACAYIVERARAHFAEASKIMARVPRRATRAPRIMAEVYRGKLNTMVRRGFAPPREPVSTSKLRLAFALLRHLIF